MEMGKTVVKRVAQAIRLAPGAEEKYVQIHTEVWPDVLEQIKSSNIRNYSIYKMGDLLISYFEYIGTNYEKDMAAMAEDKRTQEWWAITDPLQLPLEGRTEGEWWMVIPEVFHVD